MKKILQLAQWKLYALFLLPIAVMLIVTNVGIGEQPIQELYNIKFYTIFGTLTVLLLIAFQYWVGFAFYEQVQKPALGFKINGVIPVLFFLLLLIRSLYEFWLFLQVKESYLVKRPGTVLRPVDLGVITTLFNMLLLHSIITLFINTNLVAKQIEILPQREVQQEYTSRYLRPMKTVTRTLIIGLVLSMGYAFVSDVVKAFG